MVTTNDPEIAARVRLLRSHGQKERYCHTTLGYNQRMTEMQAAIGRVQLRRLSDWRVSRRRNAEAILSAARECSVFRVPMPPGHVEHAWYKAYLFIKPSELRSGWGRDRVLAEINSRGVPCSTGTCSEVYLEKAFENTKYRPAKRLPVAQELGETSLMFMVHPTLTASDVAKTCEIIRDVGRMAHA